VDVAKVLKDFGKDNPALVVKGGILGQDLLSAADASALADVEPREVLLAKLAGGMAAPMQKFAGLLQALPRNMAYGLKALIDQGGAPGAPADAPAEPEAEPTAEAEDAPSAEAPSDETAAESTEDTATDSTPDQTEEQATDEAAAENTEEQES
jgi:large subunit ribosomal protein L10